MEDYHWRHAAADAEEELLLSGRTREIASAALANWKSVKPKCVFDPVGLWCMTHHRPEITCIALREDE